MSELLLRPGTLDGWIFEEVHVRNVYRLPGRFGARDVVVDVGAHVGVFALAALERACGRVYCVEADEENYGIAARNLKTYIEDGRVSLARAAVWRSDENEDVLRFGGYTSAGRLVNTGGGNVIWSEDGPVVPKMPFDELVRRAASDGEGRVRLVKLDCEGAEWPILFTSEAAGATTGARPILSAAATRSTRPCSSPCWRARGSR